MRLLFSTVIIVLFSVNLLGASVSGRIIDASSGRPVSGVTVGIDSLYLVTRTSPDGTFNFTDDIEPGTYTLHIADGTYGHHTYRIKVKRDFYMEIEINENLYSTDPGIITYTERLRQTRQKITRDNIQTYPMRGAGDSLHLLQTLPGVGGGYSLATVPIIRGTNPLLTKYYIDGIPVNNPYHYAAAFVPVISAVNEEAIDQAVLYKNDTPVWMGDSAGNAVDIKTKNPNRPGLSGKAILDPVAPLIPTVMVSGIPDPDWGIVAVGRRSTTDVLLDLENNEYSFGDYYAKVFYNYGNDHRFSLMFNGSYDDFAMDDNMSQSGYDVEALSWEYYMRRTFFLETRLSRYGQHRNLVNNVGNDATIRFDPVQYRLFQAIHTSYDMFMFTAGYEYTNYSNGAESNIGLDAIAEPDGLESEAQFDTVHYEIEGHGVAFFGDIMLESDRLWGHAGVRYDYYGVEDTQNAGYNAEIGYKITESVSVYGKAGRYIAHPDMLYYIGAVEQNPEAGAEEDAEPTKQSALEDTITDSFAVGMVSRVFSTFVLQSEAYYTRFENMHPGGRITTVNNDEYRKLMQLHKFAYEEDGYNYGVELYLKGTLDRNYSGWISYSYQETVRNTSDNEMTDLINTTQTVKEMDSEFSQTHIFRALAAARWGKWQPSLVFHAYSSLPYTELDSVEEFPGDITVTTFKDENSSRYDLHHRLDAKVNYYYNDCARFYAEVWNLYLNSGNTVADLENDPSDTVADIPFFLWFGLEICF